MIGVPDARWGETGHAWVVLAPGATTTPDDVLAYLETRLARFKHPRAVELVDTLPRNPTGKLDKGALRCSRALNAVTAASSAHEAEPPRADRARLR